jgi:hypothetical protein
MSLTGNKPSPFFHNCPYQKLYPGVKNGESNDFFSNIIVLIYKMDK